MDLEIAGWTQNPLRTMYCGAYQVLTLVCVGSYRSTMVLDTPIPFLAATQSPAHIEEGETYLSLLFKNYPYKDR
jgi:hypothetical protein